MFPSGALKTVMLWIIKHQACIRIATACMDSIVRVCANPRFCLYPRTSFVRWMRSRITIKTVRLHSALNLRNLIVTVRYDLCILAENDCPYMPPSSMMTELIAQRLAQEYQIVTLDNKDELQKFLRYFANKSKLDEMLQYFISHICS